MTRRPKSSAEGLALSAVRRRSEVTLKQIGAPVGDGCDSANHRRKSKQCDQQAIAIAPGFLSHARFSFRAIHELQAKFDQTPWMDDLVAVSPSAGPPKV